MSKRADAAAAGSLPRQAYWEGRIDGHCLQNAISRPELINLAQREGFKCDWSLR